MSSFCKLSDAEMNNFFLFTQLTKAFLSLWIYFLSLYSLKKVGSICFQAITYVTRSRHGQKNFGKKSLLITFQCVSINIVILNRQTFSGLAALAHRTQSSFLYQFTHMYAHTYLRSC